MLHSTFYKTKHTTIWQRSNKYALLNNSREKHNIRDDRERKFVDPETQNNVKFYKFRVMGDVFIGNLVNYFEKH